MAYYILKRIKATRSHPHFLHNLSKISVELRFQSDFSSGHVTCIHNSKFTASEPNLVYASLQEYLLCVFFSN